MLEQVVQRGHAKANDGEIAGDGDVAVSIRLDASNERHDDQQPATGAQLGDGLQPASAGFGAAFSTPLGR